MGDRLEESSGLCEDTDAIGSDLVDSSCIGDSHGHRLTGELPVRINSGRAALSLFPSAKSSRNIALALAGLCLGSLVAGSLIG